MITLTFNTVEIILLSVTCTLFIIQLIYYLGLYNRIIVHNKAVCKGNVPFTDELPPISIILYTRNEAENLRNLIPELLAQDYPQFEVVVINDASTDETEDVLRFMEEKYTNLYHSFTPESARYISHKKLALTLGIKASKYDWLLFTETNCMPASKNWLRLMARNFTPQTQIVLGYSGFNQTKGWLQKRIVFDTLFQSMRYLGFALIGKPYMGVGKNMAYRKEVFFKQKGYSRYLNLKRGEDDLFINHIANGTNTRVETAKDATIMIKPFERYKDWEEEKTNYRVTSLSFIGNQRFILGAETTSRLLFYSSVIACIALGVLNSQWLSAGIVLLFFLIRYIVQLIIINRTAKEMNERRRYYFTLPVFDILQPLQSLRFILSCKLSKKRDFLRR